MIYSFVLLASLPVVLWWGVDFGNRVNRYSGPLMAKMAIILAFLVSQNILLSCVFKIAKTLP